MIRKQSSVITKANCRIAKLNFDPDNPPYGSPKTIFESFPLATGCDMIVGKTNKDNIPVLSEVVQVLP